MTDKRICFTTCASPEEADTLARILVERELAACVNIVPGVRSFYRWKGAVQQDAELLLILKTTAARLPALRDALLAAHSYDTPEFVALTVEDGSAAYLDWIAQNVGPAGA